MRVDFVNNDLSSSFDILEIVGEGSYGVVTKCKRKSNGEIVAIKFIKKDGHDNSNNNNNNNNDEKKMNSTNKKGLRIDIYREIQILNCLYDMDKENNICYDFTNNRITKLQQILIGEIENNKYNLGLVFEYYELSLSQIIRYHRKKLNNKLFSNLFVAKILYQIFEGISVLHSNWILHRDLKPSNILIDVRSGGIIKLCDFGLSKCFQQYQTNGIHKQQKDGEIVTLYYRAPELFLTNNNNDNNCYYESTSIDMWSMGCILAELINLKPLFKIDINKINENALNKELLKNICYIMGIPSSNNNNNNNHNQNDINDLSANNTWNGVEYLDYYNRYIYGWKIKYNWKGFLFEKIKSTTFEQNDLLKKLLMMDPKNRISVQQAMNHQYFKILNTNNNNNNNKNDKHKQLLLFPNGQCPYDFI